MILKNRCYHSAWLIVLMGISFICLVCSAFAQPATSPSPEPQTSLAQDAQKRAVIIPHFWDVRQRLEKPFLNPQKTVRILTDDEYPPLHFSTGEGAPTGLSIALMKAVCEELAVPCTVQVRRFEALLPALNEKAGDVVAAAIPITADLRKRFLVTNPYHKTPARFAVRKDWQSWPISPESIAGRAIAVVSGTAHEAFLNSYWPKSEKRTFTDLTAALGALQKAEVDFLFGDGVTLSTWANSAVGECCTLIGGPYLDATFFGEGVGFIVHSDDDTLRQATDYALQKVAQKGVYADIYLRFFPIGAY
jgi:polar amino acid transport system substrate-binding protein